MALAHARILQKQNQRCGEAEHWKDSELGVDSDHTSRENWDGRHTYRRTCNIEIGRKLSITIEKGFIAVLTVGTAGAVKDGDEGIGFHPLPLFLEYFEMTLRMFLPKYL